MKKQLFCVDNRLKQRESQLFFNFEESSELKTGNLKITMETFLSSVIDPFSFKILKEREFLNESITLQCET